MENKNKKLPWPTSPEPSSTIQRISNRFRKLGLIPHSKSSPSDKSSSTLTKSSSQKGRRESNRLDSKGMEIEGRVCLSSPISSPLTLSLGTRRSFCSSRVELCDFFSSSSAKSVAVDMPPFLQIHAVDCARKARDSLETFTLKTLALTLKKEFDGAYGPAWHCIVGTSFGSFVTHSVGGFIYFSLDLKLYILLFKTTVQRAD